MGRFCWQKKQKSLSNRNNTKNLYKKGGKQWKNVSQNKVLFMILIGICCARLTKWLTKWLLVWLAMGYLRKPYSLNIRSLRSALGALVPGQDISFAVLRKM